MKTIYIIQNDINDLAYIGKTGQPITDRLSQHYYVKSDTEIHKAMTTLGKEHFRISALEIVEDDVAINKEKEYIAAYDTLFPNGYNVMLGQSLKGGNNRMKGKHLPKEWAQKAARRGGANGQASLFYLQWLDTGEERYFQLRETIADFLGVSISYIKKWLGKEHQDYHTKRPVFFENIGRTHNGRH